MCRSLGLYYPEDTDNRDYHHTIGRLTQLTDLQFGDSITLPSCQFISNLTGLQGLTIYPRIWDLSDVPQTGGLRLHQRLSGLSVNGSGVGPPVPVSQTPFSPAHASLTAHCHSWESITCCANTHRASRRQIHLVFFVFVFDDNHKVLRFDVRTPLFPI